MKKSVAKKTTAKKKAVKKAATKKASAKKATTKKTATKKAAVSSLSVNLGHVFSLKPRVETSFQPVDLLTAKHQLQEEGFATLQDAARAVAEKALELAHGGSSKMNRRKGR